MDLRLPIPILFKGEEKSSNGPEIIDLDEQVSSEDIILEWCTKVRSKFKSYFIADTERNLDTLMKWYIQFLKEEAMKIDDCSALKIAVIKHIQFFKMIFSELDCLFVDNYLDNMEDILALYCDIESRFLPKKTSGSGYASSLKMIGRKLIATFNLILMGREERIHHVLMKMKLNSSEESTDLLNFLYGKLLTKKPKNKSDLAFCRAYILYQKWKMIQKPELWPQMDTVMYEQFDRTADSLKNNETLNQILFPENESVLNVLTCISNNYMMMTEEYFKFMKSQHIQEDSIVSLEVINVDLDEQTASDETGNVEHENFDRAYNDYVESMAGTTIARDSNTINGNNRNEQPADTETDDDCIIVGVGTIDFGQSNSDLVCEISDDEDIMDIIFFQPKQENPRVERKDRVPKAPSSFLDSIDISDTPSNVTSSPPSSPIIFTAVTPPSSKESDSHRDSDRTSDFTVPKLPRRKPKKTRRLSRKQIATHPQSRKLTNKMAVKRMMIRKRRRDKENNNHNKESKDPDVDAPKSVNHIETQTDFQPAEPEEIFRPYKCLVTPPSEHHEDRDIDIGESNVYANILPSASARSSSESELHKEAEWVASTQADMDLESQKELAAQEPIDADVVPESSKALPGETELHPLDTGDASENTNVSDSSPSSSTIPSVSTGKRVEYYSSPTSPDVSSTSHENDANTSAAEHLADNCSRDGSDSEEPPIAEVIEETSQTPPSESAIPPPVSKWTYRDFDKFQEELNGPKKCGLVHSKWGTLIENHGLEDNFLTGPIKKVNGSNGCVNPYKNFDLFGNQTPPPLDTSAANDSSKTSSSGIPSPAYEGMCDFENYLTSYKEQMGSPSKPADTFKTPNWVTVRRPNVSNNDEKMKNKKKSLAFATVDVETTHPHTPQAIPTSAIQGILKKPTVQSVQIVRRSTRPRIPRRLMNLKSLKKYMVKPNDPCLQDYPVVVMERISDVEISRWATMSEISRKVRMQRQQTRYMLSTSLCRVDYDKSTLTLNENDRIQYNTASEAAPEAMLRWRSDEGDRLNAGGLEGDLPYTDKKNGKRKRKESKSDTTSCQSSYEKTREATESIINNTNVRRTSRTRIVPDKDYDSLVKGGYTARFR